MANEAPLVAVIDALLRHQAKLISRVMAMTKPEAAKAVAEHDETMAATAPAKPAQPPAAPSVEFDTPAHGAVQR